jgi:hypothetical protein
MTVIIHLNSSFFLVSEKYVMLTVLTKYINVLAERMGDWLHQHYA